MTPKHSDEGLSSVSKCKEAVMCLIEKCMLGKLHSGMSYSAVGCDSILINQQYILNKVSLNKNTHKTRLCTDQLMKIRAEARRKLILGAVVHHPLIQPLR